MCGAQTGCVTAPTSAIAVWTNRPEGAGPARAETILSSERPNVAYRHLGVPLAEPGLRNARGDARPTPPSRGHVRRIPSRTAGSARPNGDLRPYKSRSGTVCG